MSILEVLRLRAAKPSVTRQIREALRSRGKPGRQDDVFVASWKSKQSASSWISIVCQTRGGPRPGLRCPYATD